MSPLLGIAVVVVGFALRVNPLLAVALAALTTGLCAGMSPVEVIAAFGKAFNANRYVSVIFLILPVIGLLERYGLRERARVVIGRLRGATAGRLLIVYFLFRQVGAACGFNALGGHAGMVRPLIAPMAEAAAETAHGPLTRSLRDHVRAQAAATENIAVCFSEDIFIAMSSVLLIRSTLASNGFDITPLGISVWSIPTAIVALVVHLARMVLLDRRLARRPPAADEPEAEAAA